MRERKANMTNRIAAAIAVGCVAFVASATDYYWIGGESGEWAKYYNWSLTPGGVAASTYPSDYSVDQATIASDTVITLPGSNANVSNLFVNANVELKDGKIHAKTISGSGKLTMRPYTTFYASEDHTEVSVDVEIPENIVYVSTTGKDKNYGYGVWFTAECALTGSGTIQFDSFRPSNRLYWDASGFSGTVVVVEDLQTRNNTTICSTGATHAGMAWQVVNSAGTDTGFITQEGKYEFGSLSGRVYFAKDENYGYVKDVIMEVGALNCNDVLGGRVSRSAGRANDGAYIRKVGTGVLSSSVAGVNGYYIKEGVLNIASDDGLSVKDDYSNPGTDIVFEGGVLRLAAGVTKDASAYIALSGSSSPVVFDDEGRNHVWNTALGESLTGGLTKKGSGTLTLGVAPSYTGTTTIEGGYLVVPRGTVIESLSCMGGKLTVPFTGAESNTVVLTIAALASGTTVADLEAAVEVAGATMIVESGVSGYVVKATYDQPYMWTGAVDNDWGKPGNWIVGGTVPEAAPHAADSVLFPTSASPWKVYLPSDITVVAIRFDGATTLSNALIFCSSITATAEVTLADGAGFGDAGQGLSFASMNLNIVASTNVPACFRRTTSGYALTIPSTCVIRGTGALRLECAVDMANNDGTYLAATMGEFAGTVYLVRASGGSQRDNTKLAPSASSSNAVWMARNYSRESRPFFGSGIYYFGAISGSISHDNQSQKGSEYAYLMEIGHLGHEDSLGGRFFSRTYTSRIAEDKYQPVLRKVGTGTLTFTGREIAKYEIDGGVLYCKTNACFETYWSDTGKTQPYSETFVADGQEWHTPITFGGEGGTLKLGEAVTLDLSTNFVNSTRAISIDDCGTNRTWTGVIAASNAGGFTKKGAGTLTLMAVPLYTGVTTVEAGVLAVPAGTVLDVCFAGGTVMGANCRNVSFAEGYVFRTGTDAAIVASGTADASNLVIYITDPAATAAYPVLGATGGLSGTPTLAFPPETSDKLKERWLLRVGGKSVSVGTRMGGIFVLR